MSRTLCWFSCGAASAVATKLTLESNPLALPVRIIVKREHPDNWRFADDCLWWFMKPIIELQDEKYGADPWQVWEQTGYLNGPGGARCSTELKKKVRQNFQRPDDVHVFGYHIEEWERAKRLREMHPELDCRFPLIERMITKEDCYKIVQDAGLILPLMYRLGYNNANCVGCCKGGKGYFNKIKVDFPHVFEWMAQHEEKTGNRFMVRTTLRDLKPGSGSHKDLVLPSCGMFCGENE